MDSVSERWIAAFKWGTVAVAAGLPGYHLIAAALEGSAPRDRGGSYLIFVTLLFIGPLAFALGVYSKHGVAILGTLLLAISLWMWVRFMSLSENEFAGLIPLFGSIFTALLGCVGAALDSAFRYSRHKPEES